MTINKNKTLLLPPFPRLLAHIPNLPTVFRVSGEEKRDNEMFESIVCTRTLPSYCTHISNVFLILTSIFTKMSTRPLNYKHVLINNDSNIYLHLISSSYCVPTSKEHVCRQHGKQNLHHFTYANRRSQVLIAQEKNAKHTLQVS